MTANGVLQLVFFMVVLLAAAWPLGIFMARVYEGKPHLLSWLSGLERGLYRLAGVDPAGEMTWRQYAIAMLAFNLLGLLVVYGLQRYQHLLPESRCRCITRSLTAFTIFSRGSRPQILKLNCAAANLRRRLWTRSASRLASAGY